MPLTYDQQVKILKDVVLGAPEPQHESPEEMAWRQECRKEKEQADDNGHMLEIPFDPGASDDDDEDGGSDGHPELSPEEIQELGKKLAHTLTQEWKGRAKQSPVALAIEGTDEYAKPDDTEETKDDPSYDLAQHYADLWNVLEQAPPDEGGRHIPEDEMERVNEELAPTEWMLAFEDGKWQAKHEAGIEMGVAHAPKGGVTIAGTFYHGGRFIPAEALAQAPAEVQDAVAAANQAHAQRRAARGPVDIPALRNRL
jgi:hypothetical protein